MKGTSVRQLHTKTEAEEVTVGNHKSIIKEWEVKTLLVELYGIVECKLLGFHIRTLIGVSSVSTRSHGF